MAAMRIWHQSFTVLEKLPAYADALKLHIRRVARAETEVVLHGMHDLTYRTNYPGTDIAYSYLQVLHGQQFVLGALEAEDSGYDACAIMTLPEPMLAEVRSIVDIPVVGYCESAMLTAMLVGEKAGVLLFIREITDLIDRNVQRMGLSDRFVGAHYVGFDFDELLASYSDPERLVEKFIASARGLIARGATVLIPGEAPLCVLLARQGLREVDGVPVIDAIAATIKTAETLVDLRRSTGLNRCKRGFFAAKPPRERVEELLGFYGISDLVAPPKETARRA